ncbi:MAG TPA: malto-oligosyltrehalose synthase [Polyangia bacterium]|nr:malto-oligosyltrehalose synthase [Polyangia bacterium]
MTARIPGCTYRLQFNKDFKFRDATALVDYLNGLGVSDVYASPILAARPGSIHGYDVIDHSRLNPELGTESDLTALATALRERGMGMVLDVVPNHMCIASPDNHWWNDVLENGRSSPFAWSFDIDWHPPKTELHEKVLLPVLGAQYGRVLENQEIAIGYGGGAFHARYGASSYPIGPRTILPLLEPMVADLRRTHPDDHPDLLELESVVTASKNLPTRLETDPDRIRERQREKEIVKRRIDALVSGSAAVRDALERSLQAINGENGKPRSFDALESLLGEQAYRLSYWGVAAEEINYRRFFDINDLAAIRVEEPKVLEAVHAKAFELLRDGKITGLRIDHVDGLLDPLRYLQYLQRPRDGDQPAPPGADPRRIYIVVEKILTGAEELPAEWPIHGTTGYELANAVNGVFVDRAGFRLLEHAYQRLREVNGTFDDMLYRAKKLILRTAMSSELYVLARRLDRISEQHRWSRDFTANALYLALGEVIACFPVYRTYIQADSREVSPGDRLHILRALREAKRRNRSISESIFDFIGDILLLRDPEGLTDADRAERRELVLRIQQLTGPVTAKGLEDTVFYRYYPLASLNEVGGRPTAGPIEPSHFHAFCAARRERWPAGVSATSTHDTKRGEDTRARVDVLSEVPREWLAALKHWERLNRKLKPVVEETRVPGSNEEYLIYQTLVGMWPLEAIDAELEEDAHRCLVERASGYLTKALREAKVHTSWVNVNEPYESACQAFLSAILDPRRGDSPFLDDLRRFLRLIVMPGVYNSLSQLLLKITVPGVPDFYQGTELWDFSLVDPDNRRQVDYGVRRALLQRVAQAGDDRKRLAALIEQALREPADGLLKLLVASRALGERRRRREVFDQGAYLPLEVIGVRASHVIAFARATDRGVAVTVTGRLLAGLHASTRRPIGREIWQDTRVVLPDELARTSTYRDVIGNTDVSIDEQFHVPTLPVGEAFSMLPAALLVPAENGPR